MRHTIRALGLAIAGALALAATTAGEATAQELEPPASRQGYYVAAGFHALAEHNRDEGEGQGVWFGTQTTIRLGQLVTRRLGLGVQIDFGGAADGERSAGTFGLGLAGQVVLVPNLAVHGVIGLGVVSLTDPAHEGELRGAYGAAFTVGATYDWFPWKRRTGGWSVTPGVQLRALPADPISAYTATVGLEISYWTGLPKNQLDLPPDQAFTRD